MTRIAVLLMALATSGATTFGTGVPPWELAPWLATHGGLAYAIALCWLVLAPLPIVAAAVLVRRTPWPWVAVVTVHLLVPTLLVARLPHLLPGWAWPALGLSIATGLSSVVTAFPRTDAPRGS